MHIVVTKLGRHVILSIVIVMLGSVSAAAQMSPVDASEKRCRDLGKADFSGIPDAATDIASTAYVAARTRVRAFCKVRGSVMPNIGFLLLLPAEGWNGKFLQRGCGGFCGRNYKDMNLLDSALFERDEAFGRGYALLTFDGGNPGQATSAQWAYNNPQAQFDFGVRAPHVASLAGKAIVERFYGSGPRRSYFWGCSSGGQQALSEAQRFPWDFDGILVGAPSPTFSGPMMYYLWAGKALAGVVSREHLKLVHKWAIERCDLDDGVKDGIIGNPLQCRFDPAHLLCRSHQTADCLTAAQVQAVKQVYTGPVNSQGEKLCTGGPLPGSELNWISESHEAGAEYVDASGRISPWAREYFSNVGFVPAPGPGWRIADFDFDRDYKRLRMAESLFGAADNPDLYNFKAAGGKLILYQGWADQSDIPTDAIDYYETAEKTMGGRAATQAFFRLFMVPGMNHCGGGVGASEIDYLTYLEAWVEKNEAPEVMIGSHLDGERFTSLHDPQSEDFANDWERFRSDPKNIRFTRPIYPYPIRARYKGSGDPADAANFGPVQP